MSNITYRFNELSSLLNKFVNKNSIVWSENGAFPRHAHLGSTHCMRATEPFMHFGGSELAPCSTTPNLKVAVRYARDWSVPAEGEKALIFRVLVDSFMAAGPNLKWLSAFPHENEALYPPLTFFKPVRKPVHLIYDGSEFTIVDVKPTFPS
jgi:hypothetical protein